MSLPAAMRSRNSHSCSLSLAASRRSGFTSVGVFGLNQHDSLATKILQHLKQPVVEAADFDYRPKATAMFGTADESVAQRTQALYLAECLLGGARPRRRLNLADLQLIALRVDRFQGKTFLGSPVKFKIWPVERQGRQLAPMKIDASSIGEPLFKLCKLYVSNLSMHKNSSTR